MNAALDMLAPAMPLDQAMEAELFRQRHHKCETKIPYRSKAAARREAIRMASSFRRGKPTRFWPYECPLCGQWHLTKKPQKGSRK